VLGAALVLAAAALLGANPIAAKLSYDAGLTVVGVLAVRYAASTAVMVPLALASRRRGAPVVTRGRLLAFALAYVASATAYFGALQLGRVTDVAPLVFLYPAMVALVGIVAFGESRDRRRMLAVALGVAGSACIFGAPSAGDGEILAKALALLAAMGSAAYFLVGARGFALGSSLQGVAALCALGALIYLPALALAPPSADELARAWPYLLGMAVLGTALPLGLLGAGMTRLGSTPAAVLSLFEAVVTVLLALVLLAERMEPLQVAGTLLVLASFPLAVARGRREKLGSR
jgi:drug/metabolite transporter (DMT)-like permease